MEQELSFAVVASLIWILIAILAVWSIVWKGFALWHSSKRNEKWWFVLFLFVQTAGLLEIIYLAFVAKIWSKKVEPLVPPSTSPNTPVAPAPTPAVPTPTPVVPPTTPETTQDTTNK